MPVTTKPSMEGAALEQQPLGEPSRAAQAKRYEPLEALWDARRFLLASIAAGAALSVILVLLIPVRYQATAQLMPPDGQSGTNAAVLSALAGRAGAFGGLAGDFLGIRNSSALFVGILESRTLRDRLIEQFGLKRLYGTTHPEDARMALAGQTSISEDHKSGIISITVTDHDARRSAQLAEAYVDNLNLLVQELSTSAARRERIFLEERLVAVKKDLDAAALKFSQFASRNTAIDIPAQSKAMVEAAATLQGQLIAAESELRGLQAIYADQNVRVRSLRARVAELRAQLGKLGGDAKSPAVPSVANDASAYPAIRQLPVLGVTYADLYRQTKIQETVYELLTQQYELAKVEEAKEVPTVKILDAAVVPTKKSFPPRTIFCCVGTALSLFAACAWVLGGRAWRQIDPNDPGKQFAVRVAGTLHSDALALGASAHAAFARMRKRFPGETRAPAAVKTEQQQELSRAARHGAV